MLCLVTDNVKSGKCIIIFLCTLQVLVFGFCFHSQLRKLAESVCRADRNWDFPIHLWSCFKFGRYWWRFTLVGVYEVVIGTTVKLNNFQCLNDKIKKSSLALPCKFCLGLIFEMISANFAQDWFLKWFLLCFCSSVAVKYTNQKTKHWHIWNSRRKHWTENGRSKSSWVWIPWRKGN